MTTSDEWAERFAGYVPRDPHLPRAAGVNGGTAAGGDPRPDQPPAPEPGDPGPQPPEGEPEPAAAVEDRFLTELQELGDMARQGMRMQAAATILLGAYARLFVSIANALSLLQPGDLDGNEATRQLLDGAQAVERALTAQQPH